MYMIMEFMSKGDLKDVLVAARPKVHVRWPSVASHLALGLNFAQHPALPLRRDSMMEADHPPRPCSCLGGQTDTLRIEADGPHGRGHCRRNEVS